MLHRHFRALCRALADVDEWGQVVMIGLLTRYARTQFTSPGNAGHDEVLDPDHSLLIVSARSLLQSRNCAVVRISPFNIFHTNIGIPGIYMCFLIRVKNNNDSNQ